MASKGIQDGLEIYLKQINQVPLLTADQEKDLARRILKDNCAKAREQMIRADLRLVVKIAKWFNNRGLPLTDLIEEGNLGLMRTVESFDPDQGTRFSTYACWWIKQSIKRALLNAVQPIHIPAYMIELVTRWRRVNRELETRYGRPPTNSELGAALELPPRKLRALRKAILAIRRPLHTSRENDDQPGLSELIRDSRLPAPDEAALMDDDILNLRRLLDDIDQREARVLRLRFGLDGREPLTLKEIGEEIGLTRERVRQIEAEALRKLNQRFSGDAPEATKPEPGGGIEDKPRRRRGRTPRKMPVATAAAIQPAATPELE